MTTIVGVTARDLPRAAWILLVVLSAAWTADHVVGAFLTHLSPLLFIGLAIVDLATVVILCGPYRRLRRWSWWAVWVEIALLTSVVVWATPSVGIWYGALAVVMAVAQLLTRRAFRAVP